MIRKFAELIKNIKIFEKKQYHTFLFEKTKFDIEILVSTPNQYLFNDYWKIMKGTVITKKLFLKLKQLKVLSRLLRPTLKNKEKEKKIGHLFKQAKDIQSSSFNGLLKDFYKIVEE